MLRMRGAPAMTACSTGGESVSVFPLGRRIAAMAAITVAAASLPATLLDAALTNSTPTPQQASLAGQLLVATPDMGDPRFARAVILIVRHDRTGAFGIVINRPLGEGPLAD